MLILCRIFLEINICQFFAEYFLKKTLCRSPMGWKVVPSEGGSLPVQLQVGPGDQIGLFSLFSALDLLTFCLPSCYFFLMSSSCFPFVLPMLLFCLPNVFQMYLFSLPSVFLLCHYSVFLTSNALLVLFSLLPSGQLNKKIFQELQRWFCKRHVNCFQASR